MDRTELTLAAAAALFAAFLLGWLAAWLARRAGSGSVPLDSPVAAADELRQARADAETARAAAREAQIEIEELRAYIDRKLAPQRPGG